MILREEIGGDPHHGSVRVVAYFTAHRSSTATGCHSTLISSAPPDIIAAAPQKFTARIKIDLERLRGEIFRFMQ